MSRMVEDKENFLSKITAARSFIYEVRSFSVFSELKLSADVIEEVVFDSLLYF